MFLTIIIFHLLYYCSRLVSCCSQPGLLNPTSVFWHPTSGFSLYYKLFRHIIENFILLIFSNSEEYYKSNWISTFKYESFILFKTVQNIFSSLFNNLIFTYLFHFILVYFILLRHFQISIFTKSCPWQFNLAIYFVSSGQHYANMLRACCSRPDSILTLP